MNEFIFMQEFSLIKWVEIVVLGSMSNDGIIKKATQWKWFTVQKCRVLCLEKSVELARPSSFLYGISRVGETRGYVRIQIR